MNGQAACSDGSAGDRVRELGVAGEDLRRARDPELAQTAWTIRVVCSSSPLRLASQGGTAGTMKYVMKPHTLTVRMRIA